MYNQEEDEIRKVTNKFINTFTNEPNKTKCEQKDIEDTFVPRFRKKIDDKPYNVVQDADIMRKIVREMLMTEILTHDDMLEFIKIMQSKHHQAFGGSVLLYFYRLMCNEGEFEYNDSYEKLLRVKSQRSDIGVLVVALFTSPYPGIDLTKNKKLWKWLMRREVKDGDPEIANLYKNIKGENIFEDINSIDISEEEIKNFEDKYVQAGSFSCEYDCDFCPKEPGMPRSYYVKEPGVLRAFHNMFDPVMQMRDRIGSYLDMGHPIDKLEILVLGGTWSSYPESYRDWFINQIYYAANTFFDDYDSLREILPLEEEKKINKTTKCKIIGLTLETRPDRINAKELIKYRQYGVTRVQLGVQSFNDAYLDRINRGCKRVHFTKAAELLSQFGFKFDIHIMFDLPHPFKEGVCRANLPRDENGKVVITKDDIDWERDIVMDDIDTSWNVLFNPKCYAYQMKLYPCELVPFTEMYEQDKKGLIDQYGNKFFTADELEEMYNWSSYSNFDMNQIDEEYLDQDQYKNGFISFMKMYIEIKTKQNADQTTWKKADRRQLKRNPAFKPELKFNLLFMVIMYFKMHVKDDVRLNRVIRDIPELYHRGGVQKSNTRQLLHDEMKLCGFVCRCIRCRQVKNNVFDPDDVDVFVTEREAHGGLEHFIQVASNDRSTIIGFIRLRFHTNAGYNRDTLVCVDLENAAMITELHVYGEVKETYKKKKGNTPQHRGYGSILLEKAFELAKNAGYEKISVIPGEGVTSYYERFGFVKGKLYHVKNLTESEKIDPKDYVPLECLSIGTGHTTIFYKRRPDKYNMDIEPIKRSLDRYNRRTTIEIDNLQERRARARAIRNKMIREPINTELAEFDFKEFDFKEFDFKLIDSSDVFFALAAIVALIGVYTMIGLVIYAMLAW